MAKNRNSFEKRQRERDRQARAQAKRARRQERHERQPDDNLLADATSAPETPVPGPADEAALLEEFARLHQRLGDGDIDLDEFEERKAAISERLAAGPG